MEIAEILPQLQDWFPVEDHRDRQIKGGGRWYYIPHQAIRDRLNELCPSDWSTVYDGPHVVDGEPIYHCRLTICGVTRTGIGDKSNEPSPYGTSAQRAFRKAFTDAAEQFGIGAYLDDQTNEKTKKAFVKYMQAQGNGKASSIYQQNQKIRQGIESPKLQPDESRPSGQTATIQNPKNETPINDAQRKRLYAIATTAGRYTDNGFRRLVVAYKFQSSKDITKGVYEELCDKAGNPDLGVFYNQEPEPIDNAIESQPDRSR